MIFIFWLFRHLWLWSKLSIFFIIHCSICTKQEVELLQCNLNRWYLCHLSLTFVEVGCMGNFLTLSLMTIHLRGRRGKTIALYIRENMLPKLSKLSSYCCFCPSWKSERFFKVRFCKHPQFYRKKYSEIDIGCYRGSGGD